MEKKKTITLSYFDREDHHEEIAMDEVNYLAWFATTLEPLPEVTEAAGYARALETYYIERDDSHQEAYLKLISAFEGKKILLDCIQLNLLEAEMRENGINRSVSFAYAKAIREYQRSIDFIQAYQPSIVEPNQIGEETKAIFH